MGPSALELARKRCEELPAHLEKCREALSISGIDTPIDFGCPITHEMMVDPVVASDGHSYEREALMEILGDLVRSGEHTKLSTDARWKSSQSRSTRFASESAPTRRRS
jgi:hypothetical protein